MTRHTIPDTLERVDVHPGPSGARERSVAMNLVRSLRPEQWTKNLIIFAALLFGERLLDPSAIGYATAAFAIFCLLSGVV